MLYFLTVDSQVIFKVENDLFDRIIRESDCIIQKESLTFNLKLYNTKSVRSKKTEEVMEGRM